jgi:hypothetical protein
VRDHAAQGFACFHRVKDHGATVREVHGYEPATGLAATVNSNGFDGLFLSGGSRVYLAAGTIISGNGRSGISLMDTSLAQKFRATFDIHITNNTKYGIVCSDPPAVAQIVGFTFQQGNVIGNPLGNIACPISPGPKAP